MKKKILLLIGSILLICGCGKIPTLKNGEQAVVTFKDGNKISADTLYNALKKDYGMPALVTMIDKYVLESEFKDDIEDCKEKASSSIKALEEQYGDEEGLLQAIQQYTNYQSVEAFEDYYYLTFLQETASKAYAKTLVEEKAIKKYYDDSVFGDVKVKHILIIPDVKDDMTDDEKTKADNKAKDTVNTIIAELKKADNIDKKFTELVKKYSEDDDTKDKNGDLGYINYGTLSSAYDELVKAALELKNGTTSTKIITTELGYHVIYRVDQKAKKSLDDAKEDIITTLSEKLLTDDTTVFGKALQFYRKKYGVDIIDNEIQKKYAAYVQSTLTEKTDTETETTEEK